MKNFHKKDKDSVSDRNQILRIISNFEISEQQFDQLRELEKSKETDFILAVKMIDEIARLNKEKQWGFTNKQIQIAYYQLSLFSAEHAIPNSTLHKKFHLYSLITYLSSGVVKKVSILSSKNCCEECKKMNGKIFSIEEALSVMPLPVADCSNDYLRTGITWCRCMYTPLVE